MLLNIGLLALTHLVIPVAFLLWLWNNTKSSKLDWFAKLLIVSFYTIYIFWIGRWDWFGYSLRFMLAIVVAAIALKSFLRSRSLALYPPRTFKNYFALAINSLVLVFFFMTLQSFIPQGFYSTESPIQLAFPLKMGTYYISQGGNHPVLNYHNVSPAQQYALDIVRLNFLGTRANGIYPQQLTNYAIFGETLYSPCDGTITNAIDNLPDLIPPQMDRQHPAGNYVLMQCEGFDILMAHLLRGSVIKKVTEVKTGDAIAKVGNSGNTSEPHLHIHARKSNTGTSILEGEGVPMMFEDRFLVRNSLVFSK
jgi:Peptidase family M23